LARRAPFQTFFENIPKVAIITALVYIIMKFFSLVAGGVLDPYMDKATWLMLFGAVFGGMAIAVDVAYTGTFEPGESFLVGFVNYIALLFEYATSNWEVFKTAAMYAIYMYVGIAIFAVIVYVAGFYAGTRKATK
jgi:hypothetical protein